MCAMEAFDRAKGGFNYAHVTQHFKSIFGVICGSSKYILGHKY